MNRTVIGMALRFRRLVAVGAAAAFTLFAAQLVLAAPDDPDFSWTPASPQVGQPVTFTASNLKPNSTVQWDFGDGGSATGTSVQHTYSTAGQKTVRMRVSRPGEQAKEIVHTVTVTAPPPPPPPPPPPNQPPTAAFTASPNPATVGETVNFNASGSSDPDGTIVKYEWDLDGNGVYELSGTSTTPSRSYSSAGTFAVKLRVTDDDGATDVHTVNLTVNAPAPPPPPPPPPNQPPSASVVASPNPATVGQSVNFNASGSSDPDGTIVKYEWDLDGNGAYESTTTTPTTSRSYSSAATYSVKVRVTDDDGATDVRVVNLVVSPPSSPPPPNQSPTASFTASPNPAFTGQTVTFNASDSADADGAIVKYQWDLDGDGSFETDTGTNRTASKSYSGTGTVAVKLRVTDDDGAVSAVRTVDLSVTAPPTSPVFVASSPTSPALELLSPFPVVRIVGRVTRSGTRIRFVAVRGPGGAKVTARCRGRGCTFRSRSKLAGVGRVRFGFRRILRPGARITILVTKPNRIGKYTSFVIRRGRSPARRDLCMWPSDRRPRACPSA